MGLFRAAGPPVEYRSVFPEPVIPPFPGADYSMSGGDSPNVGRHPDLAMTVPAVWACVSLLAGSASSISLDTYRDRGDTPREITSPTLIKTPAEGMPQSAWVHQVMVSLLLRGNAICRVVDRDVSGRPTQLLPLNPDGIDMKVSADTGNLEYRNKATGKLIDPETLWHMPGITMPGSKVGMSPIAYGALTIGVDISALKFGNDFFVGGGIPKAILKSDAHVDQEQARTLKERLLASFRSREPIVLGNGVDYQMISVRPEESQFLATQQASVTRIAQFFSVPPEMVGGSAGHSLTYANVEQRSLHFLNYGLGPWLKRIEDHLSMLLPSTMFVKFREKDLLRLDAHTRAQTDMYHLAGKVMTPTEIRDSYGLPPMTPAQKAEADMVPLGVGPLGRPTAMPGLKTPPGPVAPTPADDHQNDPQGAP
ncbi:MAG: phage portal protein [Acidimicrobiales bacterium]